MKYLALIIVLVSACSPKTTPPIEESNVSEIVEDVPCPSFENLTPSKREEAETAFVLYKDYMQLKEYDEAMPYWKTAYRLAPGSNGSVKSHFDDGVTLYANLMSIVDSEEAKMSYMDSIKLIYSKRELCFDADVDYYAQKGFDYYYKLKQYVSNEEIFATFKKAVDLNNGVAPYYIINPFTKIIYDQVLDNKGDNQENAKYAVLLAESISKGLKECKGKACESWEIINDYSPDLLSALEGVDGFYDCEYYSNKYYALYESNPEDCEVINTAFARMKRGGCTSEEVKLSIITKAKDEKCYTPPPPPGNLRQGYDAYQEGDYSKAISFFDAYVKETDDVERKAKYLLLIAKIYYGDVKNFPKSRTYARMAAKLKPNWGEPYILIGKLYASSGPLCGPGRGWDSQIVTWPAIDMFQYAKKIDPEAAEEAQKWINTYWKYMPDREDIFQRSIEAGSSFFVPCWIRENTIVRTSD